MKLKALTVQNFQRHKKISLVFSRTLTTLVGSTDAGKSALLRALRWVCLNDFVGSDFIREGAQSTEVQISFRHQKADHQITRIKGDRVNSYELDGKEYKSFATNVPEDIARSLQLSEINFQGQHDAPFWFNETAGEVSRRLNAVVDLSVIDIVMSKAAAVLRESESLVKVGEQRMEKMNQDQQELNPQLGRIAHFETIRKLRKAYDQKNEYTDHLETIFQEGSSYSQKLVSLRARIASAGDLQKRMGQWLQRERQVATLGKLLPELDALERITQPPSLDAVTACYESARSTQQRIQELEALVGEVTQVEQTIKTATEKNRSAALVFHRATKNERCPMCQNPI